MRLCLKSYSPSETRRSRLGSRTSSSAYSAQYAPQRYENGSKEEIRAERSGRMRTSAIPASGIWSSTGDFLDKAQSHDVLMPRSSHVNFRRSRDCGMNMRDSGRRLAPHWFCLVTCLVFAGCTVSANNKTFFGKTDPPRANVLRYITGDEPESIDPHKTTGQPETRILMALYEGLVEYDPKTMDPIPAI